MNRTIIASLLCLTPIFNLFFTPFTFAAPLSQQARVSHPLDSTKLLFDVYRINASGSYWGEFKWKVSADGQTAKLLPTSGGKIMTEQQMSQLDDYLLMGDHYKIKITDKDNNVIAQRNDQYRITLREFVYWLKAIDFKLGDYGIQVDNSSNTTAFSVVGKIINYGGKLNLDNAWKSAYTSYAVVPSSEGIYARLIDQNKMDVNAHYTIKPVNDPNEYLSFSFDDQNMIAANRRETWKLAYDKKHFAYRVEPSSSDWPKYAMFWNSPSDKNVVLSPLARESSTLGEYWHFKAIGGNQYRITPFTHSDSKLNLDSNRNISANYKSGYNNQKFVIEKTDDPIR